MSDNPFSDSRRPLRVLAISDIRGWAFDRNMRDMEQALGDRADVAHFYISDYKADGVAPDWDAFDVVFNVYHRNPLEPPWDKTAGSLRGTFFSPQRPVPPGPREVEFVNRHATFHTCTARTYMQLRPHCPQVWYLTNPVDMGRFPRAAKIEGEIIAQWNGNAGHDSAGGGRDIKGFRSIIQPAVEHAEIPLVYAEYSENRLPPDAMPEYYLQANVALCASLYEGASNSVMEAMAAGQAVIATDVGNHAEMQHSQLLRFGETGIWLVERNVEAFVEALRLLRGHPAKAAEMGRINRQSVEADWSWERWADAYLRFLKVAAWNGEGVDV